MYTMINQVYSIHDDRFLLMHLLRLVFIVLQNIMMYVLCILSSFFYFFIFYFAVWTSMTNFMHMQ